MVRIQLNLDDDLNKKLKDVVKKTRDTHKEKINVSELIRATLTYSLNEDVVTEKVINSLLEEKTAKKKQEEEYQKELAALRAKYNIDAPKKRVRKKKEDVSEVKEDTQSTQTTVLEEKKEDTQPKENQASNTTMEDIIKQMSEEQKKDTRPEGKYKFIKNNKEYVVDAKMGNQGELTFYMNGSKYALPENAQKVEV